MARRRARAGARSSRPNGSRTTGREVTPDVGVIPRVLLGAVNGVEIVAVGALQFSRDVLLSVVSAVSRMVGDIAGTAQGTIQEALYNARHARPGASRVALRRPAATAGSGEAATPVTVPSRRRGRRQRAVA
jgi:hypothetical protein